MALPTLQLSGTVLHASTGNGSRDAVSVVGQLVRFSPAHYHTLTSPQHHWAELIQLPSLVSFVRSALHHAEPTCTRISPSLGPAAVLGTSGAVPNHVGQGRRQKVAPNFSIQPHISLSRHFTDPCPDSG